MQKTQTAIKYKLTPGLHYKYQQSGSNLAAVRYILHNYELSTQLNKTLSD